MLNKQLQKLAALSFTVALVLALVLAQPAYADDITVTTTNDVLDAAGDCSTVTIASLPGSDGVTSLREAICAANNNSGSDTINFNITGCGTVCTIQPASALPTLTGGGTTIDGYTQPGALQATGTTSATLKIEIDGTSTGGGDGFYITSADNTIQGLVINRFTGGDGIYIYGSGATGNTVCGNYIGTDASGTADLGNAGGGISVVDSAQTTIGGDTPGERNVISGNGGNGVWVYGSGATGNTISGNYIGTDASGALDRGNTQNGVFIQWGAQNNTIGGDTPDERNVISGNNWDGVRIDGSGATANTVCGNYIGTDFNGAADLGNTGHGVSIFGDAHNNTIGGNLPGERNVISGNGGAGVTIVGDGNTVSGNYIGTDASGTADLGNNEGIYMADTQNTIGGDTAGERNVISGNDQNGIRIYGSGATSNTVSGNYIGTDVNGAADLGNGYNGIRIEGGAQNNTAGGDASGERNVISGNSGAGVMIVSDNNTVSGNYIGTDANGTVELGNDWSGVEISGAQNIIGGDTPGERNVISGNDRDGISLYSIGTMSNTISGNYIGTDAGGTAARGNTWNGVYIGNGAQNNTVGPDNLIAHNNLDGVDVSGSGTTGNTITQNSIFSNTLGIDLTSGANGNIAAPAIVTTTVGSINVVGAACPNCTVEVFENDDTDGEGETYVGDTTADAGGAFTVTVSSLSDPYLTATATDAISGTSKFSAVFTATVTGGSNIYLPIIMKNH